MSFLPRETTLRIDVPTGPVERLSKTFTDVADQARKASKATEDLGRAVRDMPGPVNRLPMPKKWGGDGMAMPTMPGARGGLDLTSGPAPRGGGGAAGGGGGGVSAAAGAISAVGGLFSGSAGPMLALAGPIGAVGAAALGAAGAVKGLADRILAMAGAASPGHMQLFERAMLDAQAVVGRFFVPVLQLATDAVRGLGDVLANILPNSQELKTALDPLKQALMEMKTVFIDLGPLIRDGLVLGLKSFAVSMKIAAEGLKIMTAPLRGLAGLMGPNQNPQSSMGAAPAPAKWLGVEDIGRQAAEAAFSTGIPETQAKSETYLRTISEFLTQDLKPVLNTLKAPGEVGKEIGAGVSAAQHALMEGIRFAARNRRRMV